MNNNVEQTILPPTGQECLLNAIENSREFPPEIKSRVKKYQKGITKPDGNLSFEVTFSAKPIDKYGRTYYEIKRDAFFGVADYQLDQRYGRIQHEVVPRKYEPDFVDKFDEVLCKLLSKWFNFA